MLPGSKPPYIATIIEINRIFGRETLRGVSEYLRLHGPWSIFITEGGPSDPDPAWLENWNGDGIITRGEDLTLVRAARNRGIPVVSVCHQSEQPEFPTVAPDQRLIGERVAQHFLEAGLRNFGYIGQYNDKLWEQLRAKAYVGYLGEHGHHNVIARPLLSNPLLAWEEQVERISAWLKTMPLPIGLMVSNDFQGIQLLDACRQADLRVPEDIAVVSVDNDTVLCEVAAVPLSSLDQRVNTVGFKAAELLDRMMSKRMVAAMNYFTEPGEIVIRKSSDTVAVTDKGLAHAIRFVRENATKKINVLDVAKVAGMSRRMLERQFKEQIGCTPMEEVHKHRLRHIRQLLLETDYTLPDVAKAAGFKYQEYMARFFKKETGVTPGQYRRNSRFNS